MSLNATGQNRSVIPAFQDADDPSVRVGPRDRDHFPSQLLEVLDRRVFGHTADWLWFLPSGLESFTTEDLARGMNTRRDLAQKMAYCLRESRIIDLIGRRGRANLYRIPGP